MKKQIYKISAIILILQIILQICVPMIAEAVVGTSDNRFEYTVNTDGTSITITKYVGTDTEVVIPSTIDGYDVTSIGDRAFDSCTKIVEIKIPKGVTSIGNTTFYRCISLINITIPDSVISIGSYAFTSCTSLTNIEIPDGVTSIGNTAFSHCSNLTNITIPETVTRIESQLFQYCSSLTTIKIPDSVTIIGSQVFEECSSLTSISIPENVTYIGNKTFNNCINLTSIEVDKDNTEYESVEGVLYSKDKTKLLYYPAKKEGTGYTILEGVKTIANSAFSYSSNLTSIEIPDSVTKIEEGAFYYCSNLTSIEIPEKVTKIEMDVFYGCESLTSIDVPDTITRIGMDAFPINENFVIRCKTDSVAHTYAIKNSINYELDDMCSTLTIEYSPKDMTNKNVIVTIKADEKVRKIQGWTLSSDGLSLSKTYTENTTEDVTVKDFVGNISTTTVKVENIDKLVPILDVLYSKKDITNGNVVVTIKANEKIQEIEGWTLSSDELSISKIYASNITENITVSDLAGNIVTTQIKIENIDKVAPILEVSYSTKAMTRGNVVVTIKSNERIQGIEGWTISNDGLILSKMYSANVEENVKVSDLAGNIVTTQIKIENIDKVAPTLIVGYSPKDMTNGNVVVTIKANEKIQELEGWTLSSDGLSLSKIYSVNVTENIIVSDLVGNTSTAIVKIGNIDKIAPTLTVEYSTKAITNGNVVVIIKANERIQSVSGWTLSSDELSISKTYTSNITENITVSDLAGNIVTTQIKIENIDKVAPILEVSYSTKAITKGNVVVTIKSNERVQAVEGWTLSSDGLSLSKTYNVNSTENVTVKDLAGNKTTAIVKIENIDKEAPILTVEYSPKDMTNGNVVVTIKSNEKIQEIEGWTLSSDGLSLSKTYLSNTTENVTVKDLIGNTAITTIKIENIDKIAPILTVSYSTKSITKENVVVTIKSNEKIQSVNGWTLSSDGLSLSKTYTSNITENVTVLDFAGNKAISIVRIENIDKIVPTLTVEYSTKAMIKGNVEVTIKSNEKVQEVEGWTLSTDGLSLSKTYATNVTENITVKDLVGNTATATVKIENIDKVAPTLTIQYSATAMTNGNVVAIIKSNERVQEVSGWTLSSDGLSLSKTYTSNTTENVTVIDLAGNEATTIVKIENIDKERPILNVLYSTKTMTNGNVIVTIKSNEKVQGVSGWTLSSDGLSLSKTYSANVAENVTVSDLVGNTSVVKVEIKNIDKIAPVIQGVENNGVYSSVTIKVTDENLDKVILTKDGQEITYANGEKISAKGKYEVIAIDKAGNITKVSFEIVEKAEITTASYTVDETNKYILGIKAGELKLGFTSKLKSNIGYKILNKNNEEINDTTKIGTGMKVKFETGETYEIVVTGDVNGDGKISITDIAKIKKHIIQNELLEGCYEKAGNVNSDSKISVTDLAKMKKAIIGLVEI